MENPYYQFFRNEELFFQHRLVFDRSSLRAQPDGRGAA